MLPCSLQRQRLGGDWTRADIEEVAWRPSKDGRFGWFGPQNHRAGRNRGRFRYCQIAEVEGTWSHREACVEAKQCRDGGVSIRYSYKKMDHFTPEWAVTIAISVGKF